MAARARQSGLGVIPPNLVWPLRNTGRKTDLHQICSEQIDATKVQTRRKSLTKMVTASFAPLFTTPCKSGGDAAFIVFVAEFPSRCLFFSASDLP